MNIKNAVKWLVISASSISILFVILLWHYIATTYSVTDCMDYCSENTQRDATLFSRVGDGRYVEDYAYYIAANGNSSKAQELFIFKKKHFGPFPIDRYEYVMSTTQTTSSDSETNNFGAIQFFTRDDNGDKETGATLLFYGANQDSDIVNYEYTLTVKEGSNTYTGTVVRDEHVWFVKFFDLGNIDENSKRIVSDVKFYDSEGNLVGTY